MPTAEVHLKPLGSVNGGLPASPTLYGALCWAAAVLYGEDHAQAMAQQLTCSDAFPMAWDKQDQLLRFFPMPVLVPRLDMLSERSLQHKQEAVEQLSLQKQLKRARYLSEALFRAAVQGTVSDEQLRADYKAKKIALRGNCLMTADEAQTLDISQRGLFLTEDVAHNEVDRWSLATVEGRLFHREETFFAPQAGLWFMVHLPSDELMSLLPALLRYLQDTGIGGERTSGKGQFRIHIEEQPPLLPHADSPNAWISLSHYLPDPSEVLAWQNAKPQPCYELVTWLGRYEAMYAGGEAVVKPLRRMLAPGALLPLHERREVYGRAVASGERLGHEVWVSGRALPVFARIGGD